MSNFSSRSDRALHPVGFDSSVAYECDDLVVWLVTRRASNPLTQEEKEGKITDILRPLIVGGNTRHLPVTCAKLERAGWTKVNLSGSLRYVIII